MAIEDNVCVCVCVGVCVCGERERQTDRQTERDQRGGVLSVRRPELPGAGKDTKLPLLKHPDAQHSTLAIGACLSLIHI